jgi:hypothetical protein
MKKLSKLRAPISLPALTGTLKDYLQHLPELIVVRNFTRVRLVLVGVALVVVALLAWQVLTQDVTSTISESDRLLELDTGQLESVMHTVQERAQELPRTVVGNRREYFIGETK